MSTKGDTLAGKRNMAVGMRNWNGNLLVSVDTETTGLDPELHEILEITALPIDATLELHTLYPPFNMFIRPEKLSPEDARPPGLSDAKLADYTMNGLQSHRAADMFIAWFEELNLGAGKKLMPLAHNWPFDAIMIRSWLGEKNFEHIFHGHYRDTMALAKMINDACEFNMTPVCPHAFVSLSKMCDIYGVKLMNAHTANADAMATIDLYRQMCSRLRGF